MTAGVAAAAVAPLAAALGVFLVVEAPAESRLGPVRSRGLRAAPRSASPSARGAPGPLAGRPAGPGVLQGLWSRRGPHAPAPDLDAVAALLDRLAALLRAGLGSGVVWEHLAGTPGPCRPMCAFVAESLASGGDPGVAIAGAATLLEPRTRRPRRARGPDRRPVEPGAGAPVGPADVVRWLAAAMAVSARTGAPAADCVERLAASVRAETAAADERAGALAGPRATVQVLAWLPAAGIALGGLVGANPVRTLVLAPAGRVCLLAGTLLWLAGRTWARALVRSAERAGA